MTESGLVIVAKPAGMTSHDVVARVRRLAGTRRVGHAGTLDPMATGVLVVGIGKATRLLGHLALTEKEYDATIRLGQSTTTDDADGQILPAPRAEHAGSAAGGGTRGRLAGDLPEPELRAALAALTGEITQVPPGISAIKVNGKRAYQLTSDIDVAVTCSSGTYIRAIARDLGAALRTGGHLTALNRTRVGPYRISEARTLDQLAESFKAIPLAQAAAAAFRRRDLTAQEAQLLSHGGRLSAITPLADGLIAASGPGGAPIAPPAGGPIAAFGPDGTLIALLAERDGRARPLAVFVP